MEFILLNSIVDLVIQSVLLHYRYWKQTYSVCLETISGNLQTPLTFSKDAMICLYAVPENYPKCKGNDTEYDIYFDSQCHFDKIIYGNVKMIDNHIYSLKSRTLCCLGKKII